MATYLIGSNGANGAHCRYYPQDLTPKKCRELMMVYLLNLFRIIRTFLHPFSSGLNLSVDNVMKRTENSSNTNMKC